ncbi:MAG: outer membrane protein transport protein [Nitrospirota bacterium]
MKKLWSLFAIVFLVSMCVSFVAAGSVFGAGFALIEQSVSGLGNAYAGGAAAAEDATTIFYNPAGLTRLKGRQLVFGGHVIMPYVKFHNEGSTHVLQPLTGQPLTGGNGGEAGVTKFVPNFYYSREVTDRLAVGLGVNSPFGLATEYDKDWVGRYHGIKSDVLTVNINPSMAYRINKEFSVGAGINVQYINAELSKAIDFGTLDASGSLGLPPGALGLVPQLSDGRCTVEGDDWGVGFNVGALFEHENLRVGVAYRSRIDYTLEGDADFSNVPAPLTAASVFTDTDAEADITVPDSLSVSAHYQISPQWAIMGDFTWTNWREFKKLECNFDNPNQPTDVTVENWEDSYRTSLGLTYTPNKTWTFRVGTAYDSTPVPDAEHRTPRIPDGDRIWTAFGLGYKISRVVGVDVGYAHIFVNDPEINKSPTGDDAIRGGLKGKYDAHIDILSAQVVVTF